MVVFGEADSRRVLKAYASYYNRVRTSSPALPPPDFVSYFFESFFANAVSPG